MKSKFVALASTACLLLGFASPAASADFSSAPWCPIGPNWNGEPLPIGCTTQLNFGGEKVGTGASSSDPGVVRAEFDAANNAIRILTVGYGTAEVCLEHNPIKILAPSASGDETAEVEKVTQTQSCATYTVSPELAKNCMATEVNESGFEVTTNHIHQGCVVHQGWAPPEDSSVPKVTAAWSSDPGILRVSPRNGTVRVEALAPGRASYCYERDGKAPQLGTGPFCWSLVVHPRTVNLATFTRQQAEPVCDYSQSDSIAYVHMGCWGRMPASTPGTASSSDSSVIAVVDSGWTAARVGKSKVCFTDATGDRCIDFTVFDPNEAIPSKPAAAQAAPASSQSGTSTPDANGLPNDEASEKVDPTVKEFTVKTKRNFSVRVRQVGDRLRLAIKTKLPARSKVRIISTGQAADSTDSNRSVRTVKLNKKGNRRVFLPLADQGTVRVVLPSGKTLASITW